MNEKMHDFGDGKGPVPAHRHPNGGGWIADSAFVDETAFVGRDARVYGNARVYGDARVYDYARIYGHARVYGDRRVYHNVCIFGSAQVYGDACISDDFIFIPSADRYTIWYANGIIGIGCQNHPVRHWLEHGEEIAKEHNENWDDFRGIVEAIAHEAQQ